MTDRKESFSQHLLILRNAFTIYLLEYFVIWTQFFDISSGKINETFIIEASNKVSTAILNSTSNISIPQIEN
jgi:hypothetical protein